MGRAAMRVKLKAVKGGNLWFSFIGYKPVKVTATSKMMVRMEPEIVRLLPELTGTLKNASSNSGIGMPNGITVHGIKSGEQPLVIIDGKEAVEKDALSKISPDRINSISVSKDEVALAVYGDKGKNGVIIVTLLTEEEYQAKKNQ